ncbi:MAG: hypothetical protein FJX47_09715 [Alphaproteobacteria bacterium]|nr:hypothetical protein [Alphaproteobacteria bacterium]
MKREILIDSVPGERRAAHLVAGRLVDLAVERARDELTEGSLVLARITRVAPDMQAAFLGLPDGAEGMLRAVDARHRDGAPTKETPDRIEKLVVEGETLLVQVDRAAHGAKGARLVTDVALQGRYLTYRPRQPGVGFAAGVKGSADQLKKLKTLAGKGAGLVLRPAGAQAKAAEVAAEVERMATLWRQTYLRQIEAPPLLLWSAPGGVVALLRDLPGPDALVFDGKETEIRLAQAMAAWAPDLAGRGAIAPEGGALFAERGVEDQIAEALAQRVESERGFALTIQELEALTAIDVDIGATRDRDAALIEAAREVARQARLRRLGGQIIVDFPRVKGKPRHVDALKSALATDPAGVTWHGPTRLGLIEFTRRRAGPTLAQLLGETRHAWAPSLATIGGDLFRRVLAEGRRPLRGMTLKVGPRLDAWLRGPALADFDVVAKRLGFVPRIEVSVGLDEDRFVVIADG